MTYTEKARELTANKDSLLENAIGLSHLCFEADREVIKLKDQLDNSIHKDHIGDLIYKMGNLSVGGVTERVCQAKVDMIHLFVDELKDLLSN